MKYIAVFLLLLAAGPAGARKDVGKKEILGQGAEKVEFRVEEESREQRFLRTGKDGTVVLREVSVLEGVSELRQVLLQGAPLVLSRWRKGVHGEALTLHDTKSTAPVFELKSAWPMEVEVKPDRIEVVYTEESRNDGVVPRFRYVWMGPGKEPLREEAPLSGGSE